VPRPELTVFLARCLQRLGVRRAWVVHGAGLDELSLCAPNEVAAFEGEGEIRTFRVSPADAGLEPCGPEALRGGDVAQNARMAGDVLKGRSGPARDVVLFNAAAALMLAGRAPDLREGVRQARSALEEGRALALLDRVREISYS